MSDRKSDSFEECLLTAKQVGRLYAVHEKTVWLWARAGRIPKPVQPFSRWRNSEVLAHIESLQHAELKELAT